MTELKTLITELQKPVSYEWKIQAVPKNWKKGNCVAYIDSRDCMNALDHNCSEWWQNEFYEVKWKVFCKVGIKINWEWQWRSDSWALESSEHIEEETTSKWETSDAFKRACVQWWIGRFLYEKDIIWISEEEYTDNKFNINEFCMSREKWTSPKITTNTTTQENKWSELHICRNCWEENMAKVFEWKYWPCFKCEHCDKYSKPNPVTSSHWWPDWFWNQ